MKTALVSGCLLEGPDHVGNDRLERTFTYVNYYNAIRDKLGFQNVILFDNASPIFAVLKLLSRTDDNVTIHRYSERLIRGEGIYNYPFCWRVWWSINDLFSQGYEKIIYIESDGYVLSNDLALYIKELSSGWTTFWESVHQMPDGTSIICKDAKPIINQYCSGNWKDKVGLLMEGNLPYTHIERKFVYGRFGESGKPSQSAEMDYYGQRPFGVSLQFGKFR